MVLQVHLHMYEAAASEVMHEQQETGFKTP